MSERRPDDIELDPGEVEPTDNSSGELVDLDRVEEVEEVVPPSDERAAES